jgi:hypothetical protein
MPLDPLSSLLGLAAAARDRAPAGIAFITALAAPHLWRAHG